MDEKSYTCDGCGNPVGEEEYVVNWASCAACLNANITAYFRKEKVRFFLQRAAVWGLAAAMATALWLGAAKGLGTILYYLTRGGQ